MIFKLQLIFLLFVFVQLLFNSFLGSSCNIHQIPAVPIRKKKLKKLEDIYNYCNIGKYNMVHKSCIGIRTEIY